MWSHNQTLNKRKLSEYLSNRSRNSRSKIKGHYVNCIGIVSVCSSLSQSQCIGLGDHRPGMLRIIEIPCIFRCWLKQHCVVLPSIEGEYVVYQKCGGDLIFLLCLWASRGAFQFGRRIVHAQVEGCMPGAKLEMDMKSVLGDKHLAR